MELGRSLSLGGMGTLRILVGNHLTVSAIRNPQVEGINILNQQ